VEPIQSEILDKLQMTRQVVDNCFAVADLWRAPWRPSGQNASNLIEQVVEEHRMVCRYWGLIGLFCCMQRLAMLFNPQKWLFSCRISTPL